MTSETKFCSACNATEDIQMHHLVPVSLGGDDSLLVPLCYQCHLKVHGLPKNGLNHGYLSREGQKRSTKRYDKTCSYCERAFVAKKSHVQYCKPSCRSMASRKRTAKLKPPLSARNCDQCGGEYQPKRKTSVFCSPSCRVKYNRSLRGAVRS